MTTNKEEPNDRAAYWQTVESIAKEAKEAEGRGEEAMDFIHESVDGSHYVIYTHANLVVLQEGDNESAAFDEMGDEALSGCKSYGDVMARLAYWAMRADVEAAFSNLPDADEAEDEPTEAAQP